MNVEKANCTNVQNNASTQASRQSVAGHCEAAALINALLADNSQTATSLLKQLVILSACTVAEAWFMRHEDIDIVHKVWIIPSQINRGLYIRVVPITSKMRRLILEAAKHNPASEFVFADVDAISAAVDCAVLEEVRPSFLRWAICECKFSRHLIRDQLFFSTLSAQGSLRSQKKLMNKWAAYLALQGVEK